MSRNLAQLDNNLAYHEYTVLFEYYDVKLENYALENFLGAQKLRIEG